MKRILLIVFAAACAWGARGPLVVTRDVAPAALASKKVAVLGRIGSAEIVVGREAASFGTPILAEAGSRCYYRIEGAAPAALAPFGEVLFADGGEVLLSRRYGFVYDKPISALNRAWRRLDVVETPPAAAPGGSTAPAADGRIQYLLSRVKTGDLTEDLTDLTAIPTRYSYSPYLDDAATFIYNRFRSFGLSPRYETYVTGQDFDACFFLPGTETGWVVGASGLILHTTDGGREWDIVPSGTENELVSIYFLDANHGWIVGVAGTVLRTSDGGATWVLSPPPTDKHLTGVWFVDADNGWCCGTAGVILRTADGGITWTTQDSGMTDTLFEIQFVDATHGYAVGWHGEVRRTDDGGQTWVRKITPFSDPNTPAYTVELTGLSFVSPDEGWVVGNHYDVIMHTVDGGDTWNVQRYNVSEGEYLGAVHFFDAQTGVAVGGEEGSVLRTTNGGDSWTRIDADADFPLTSVSFASADDGWASGYGSCIDYSGDRGQSWETLRDYLPAALGWKNVICDIPGTLNPRQQYIVCGHYDSTSDRPLELAPGADDNGSAVVAALAVARALAGSNFQRTIRFVLFSGEEQGLVGSRDYARRAKEREDQILGVWNMDMISYTGGGPRDAALTYNDDSQDMYEDAHRAWRLYVPGIAFTGDNNPFHASSDHYSFWEEGFKAVAYEENDVSGIYPYYHKTTDTVDKLDMNFLTLNARLTVATVATWAELRGDSPALDLGSARVYPNPFRRGGGGGAITFDGLPSDASIRVYDLAGERVAEGRADSGGGWQWNAAVGSGVYLYVLEYEDESRTGKVAVIN